MAAPFAEGSLKAPNFIQRAFKCPVRNNAIVEVNNLLAQAVSVREVPGDEIDRIFEKYRLNSTLAFHTERLGLYRKYLDSCFSRKAISDEEAADLEHLRGILKLSESETEQMHLEEVTPIYQRRANDALACGRLSDEDKTKLDALEKDLRLSQEVATRLYTECAKSTIQQFLNTILDDHRITPDEESELNARAKSYGLRLDFDTGLQSMMDRYKLLWQIEQGEVPEVAANINLQRSERCYFTCTADWFEARRVTTRINYSGPTFRLKIAKGLYWRAGSLGLNRVSHDVMTKIDSGQLYVTSKRLLFVGSRKNAVVQLTRILNVNPYKNGIEVVKDSGKTPFLQTQGDIEILLATIARAVRDVTE
jgi:hypothetical protein